MFERFTDRARRVVVLAQEEARLLEHSYIGTEHVLLGLLHDGDGVAAAVLNSLGVDRGRARAGVEELVGRGSAVPSGHIPFTPRAKKVLELSLREALQLGHNYIGTEHLLLGLLREGEGAGARVLESFGLDLAVTRDAVVDVLSGVTPAPSRTPSSPEVLRTARAGARERRGSVVQAILEDHVFARALQEHGVDPEAFLDTLDRLVAEDEHED
ncbi:MAG TPA: Clp protease N-terminal domain-containing protein [Acidimicrobiales bacterium]|nr:Clp protease N-terminal domain-containing protein [Acidimicrobiales bacterium]